MFKVILGLLVVLGVAAFAMKANAQGRSPSAARAPEYRRKKLMTDNEEEFFGRLVTALPDCYVFPQVSLSALIESVSQDPKKANSDRLRIAQQRADYVICDSQCKVIAVVELDDKTHSRTKDETRDGRLKQANIRTIRFQSRNKPSIETIHAAVFPPKQTTKGKISPTGQTSTKPAVEPKASWVSTP